MVGINTWVFQKDPQVKTQARWDIHVDDLKRRMGWNTNRMDTGLPAEGD